MSEGDRTLGVRATAPAATSVRTACAPADLAWLLAAPCALVVLAAIVLLGPPLGELLFPPSSIAFWPTAYVTLAIRPEPTEQARFLLALGGPVLLSALVVWLRGRPLPLRPATVAALVQASQVLLAAFALAALIAQYRHTYDASFSGDEPFRRVYFTPATLVVSAALTAGAALLLRRDAWTARLAAWTRETGAARVGALLAALLFVVVWLLLFGPFVATSFFMELGPPENRYGPANLFSMFPMRYGGPFLLAYLLTRHLQGARPHGRLPLFLLAGIVLLNNAEFGIPAFAATAAALLWTDTRPAGARVLALLRDGALGLLGAALLVALLTLVVVGSPPHFGMLLTFSRLWGVGGVTMLPMPALGFHLVLYATLAAALVVATVRAVAQAQGRALTALLAWAGVFGLGAGSYFAGRSHPEVLISLFSIWAFALALLLIALVPAVRARPGRRASVAEVAVLACCALTVCSLAQTPAPWTQLARIGDEAPTALLQNEEARAFVAAAGAAAGEHVAIMVPMGHRVAYDLGLVNVAPYVSLISMPAKRQLQETIDALRASGGTRLFAARYQTLPDVDAAIRAAGYELVRSDERHAEYRDATR